MKRRRVATVALCVVAAAACTNSAKRVSRPPGPAPGFDPIANTISVGVITPLTGPAAAMGKPVAAGDAVFFDHVNSRGGIAGRYKVVLVERDSAYSDAQELRAYGEIASQVSLFAQILFTPTSKLLGHLTADGLVASPTTFDPAWVREPNLLPIGAPYPLQAVNAVTWLMDEGGAAHKRVCTLASDDGYGDDAVLGVDFAARQRGATVAARKTFTGTKGADAGGSIQGLKDAGCDAVVLASTPTDTFSILSIAARLAFAPQWIGLSPSYTPALSTSVLKDYFASRFMLVAEGTEWGDRSVIGMKNMLDDISTFAPTQPPDYSFSFGYSQAEAINQVLERAVALGDLSHAGIMKAMESVGTLKLDGLSGDYGYGRPSDRAPSRVSSIFKIDPAKPLGLAVVKKNFTSDAAAQFRIG